MGIAYDPGISYHGDQFMFNALGSFGKDAHQAIAESMAEKRRQEQLKGYNDSVMSHAASAGLASADELNKYNEASLTQQTGIAAAHAANLAEDLKRQLVGAQTGNIQSETNARNTMLPAQVAGVQSETAARNALNPAQVANIQSETTLKNIQSLLGVQEGNLRTRKLAPGAVDRIIENGQFKGWKITQPDGTIAIKTPGSDIGELLAGLGVVGAGGGGGSAPSPGSPTPATTTTPTPAASGRVTIYKNGRPAGTVPSAQAQLAVQQGYSLTP